jgi:hypothetical protein
MATHILKSGETPWSLAVLYVKNGNRWPELCAANTNLPKHPTYGCVFPKVGTAINLPASWVPVTETKPNTSVTTTGLQDFKAQVEALFGKQPTEMSIQTTVTTQPNAAVTAVPAATNTVIPPSSAVQPTTAAMTPAWDPNVVKLGLLAAGVVALGAIVYFGINPGSGEHNVGGPGRTAKMSPNRRRGRKGKRKMRRNGKRGYLTKKEALKDFRHVWLPPLLKQYGPNDKVAIRAAWNDYVDYLAKDGSVRPDTDWTSPFS